MEEINKCKKILELYSEEIKHKNNYWEIKGLNSSKQKWEILLYKLLKNKRITRFEDRLIRSLDFVIKRMEDFRDNDFKVIKGN